MVAFLSYVFPTVDLTSTLVAGILPPLIPRMMTLHFQLGVGLRQDEHDF